MSNSCPTSITPQNETPAGKDDKRYGSEWSSPLVRELAIALAIKFVALFALWFAFFRSPVDADLSNHFVNQAVFGHAAVHPPENTQSLEPLHGR